MRGWRYAVPAFVVLGFAWIAAVAACSVAGGTITEYGLVGDGGVAIDDSGSPLDGAPPIRDAQSNGDGATHPFDAACGQTLNGSTLTAFASTTTKVIDGLDDDWGCEEPFDLNSADAVAKHSSDGGYEASGACKFEWTPTKVYFFCDVTDPTPGNGTSANLTVNDAIEIYISGTPVASRAGNYGTFDHQYVVDWRGMKAEYDNGGQNPTAPAALNAAVSSYSGGYKVEGSIDDTALLSGSSLAAQMTLGLDIGIDDGVGQQQGLVWTQGNHAGCNACTLATCCCAGDNGSGSMDYPYCDALAFGSMTLNP